MARQEINWAAMRYVANVGSLQATAGMIRNITDAEINEINSKLNVAEVSMGRVAELMAMGVVRHVAFDDDARRG